MAYKIWGISALLNTIFFTTLFGIAEGIDGVIIGLLIGFTSAMISTPTIAFLHLMLPKLLNMKYRTQRICAISCLVIILYLMLTIPFNVQNSSINDDGISVPLDWSEFWYSQLGTLPFLFGPLVATGYVCRALLFRSNAMAVTD